MKFVIGNPPMFAEIDAAFHIAGLPVIFAWGDTIYNPKAISIPPALIAHEAVHGQRQGADIEGWWRKYIADPAFRLAEEIPAHRAEYEWFARHPDADKPVPGWRNRREFHLYQTAKRLAAPLYGRMLSVGAAKKAILAA